VRTGNYKSCEKYDFLSIGLLTGLEWRMWQDNPDDYCSIKSKTQSTLLSSELTALRWFQAVQRLR